MRKNDYYLAKAQGTQRCKAKLHTHALCLRFLFAYLDQNGELSKISILCYPQTLRAMENLLKKKIILI